MPDRKTVVSFDRDNAFINGQITYPKRPIEGLLMNARLVQGIFDDENPATRPMWRYPDGREFDAEKNTDAFVAMMPAWRRDGLLSFTINLQGGSPQGYSKDQPWRNSAITPAGELKPAYMKRLERILDRADELGMAPMLGLFYFGQAPHLENEEAFIRAADTVTDWVLERGYTHLLIEIANECDHKGYPQILAPARAPELIRRVQERSAGQVKSPAKRLLVSTSLMGGRLNTPAMLRAVDFVLLHGNGVAKPEGITDMIERTRAADGYRGQPILFNEDDHFDFDKPVNNMQSAVDHHASWGYFDYRMKGEGFEQGYQSVPVDWGTNSDRKRGFFKKLRELAGT